MSITTPASPPSPFDTLAQQWTLIGVICVAAASFLGLPVILGALADLRGLSPEQLGQIASAETLGMAITAALSPWLLSRVQARTLIGLGMVTLALCNLASCVVSGFAPFLAVRLGASVASGLAMPAAVACLGVTSRPERAFSWAVGAQVSTSAAELFAFTYAARHFGVPGIYASLTLLTLLAGAAALRLAHLPRVSSGPARHLPLDRPAKAGLAAVLLLFACIGVYWAFIERVGVLAHLSAEDVGLWLAISNVPALLASLGAPWLAERLGERRMLLLGLGLAALVPLGLLLPLNPTGYLLNLGLFVLLWNALMVVQMAVLGRWDAQGLAVGLTPSAQAFGLALAPLLAGELAEQRGYPAAMALASGFALLALLSTWIAFRERHSAAVPVQA
ncbi:MFS transporter [Roseateles koreensis]|uniref:MFS transporter n=1 Tax=Roseateles koreensis TaxID=2987526 RepID=A0ABT5KTY2_9BURK|nr:MFS transporter [Roseateles koreensis]MDC8786392.1 MFS transporter [Roseateles koreensis]